MHVAALAAVATLAVAMPGAPPPAPTRWVEDSVGFLSPATRAALDGQLEGYEHATGHQVVVWIGKSLDGAPLDQWAVSTFAAWKLGRKGHDDGIAMFILADDRAIDIEVGYGLEDKVTDAAASRIIREVMAPRIRAGDRDGAVTAGVDSILATIEGRPWAGSTARTAPPAPEVSPFTWIVGGILILGFLIFAIKHPRAALMFLWMFSSGRNRGGGFGGGGGFSGGGGRSGGGGARGGW